MKKLFLIAVGFILIVAMSVPRFSVSSKLTGSENMNPLSAEEITDTPSPKLDLMTKTELAQRQKNLYLMDFIVQECEFRKHIIDYKPLCAHLMYDRWRNRPLVDAREEVPYDVIDDYAEWGVQRIQLHHDTWTQMGRAEPLNEAVFTRFVDYCHKKGIEVGVYLIMGTTSPMDPELPEEVYTLPLYHIRPPDTYNREKQDYRARWYMTNVFSPAWQQYITNGLVNLFERYKVDGIYYDSGAIIGACGKDRSEIYDITYHSRTRKANPNADIFNMVSNVCARYNKWITVYSNSPHSGKNYGFFSQALKYRLIGEAGDVKSLKTFWQINRGEKQGPYHVNVWNDPYTMPPDKPFYACNLVFLQFPYLMSWRKPSKEAPGEILYNEEQVELWKHYAGIYKGITKENTVAYVNTKNNKFLKKPIDDEYVACTILVRENVHMILANISDEDKTIEFTVPLYDVETGERNVRKTVLEKNGSMKIFRIDNMDSFEPDETVVEKVIRNLIDERVIVDKNNLALEGRVDTGTDAIFQYVRATQATDGNLETYWAPNPLKKDETWWDTFFTRGAFNELPVDYNDPPVRNRKWYMVELRKPGNIEKIQVVTRKEDVDRLEILTTEMDWNKFKKLNKKFMSLEFEGNKAFMTYKFDAIPVRYIKAIFSGTDVNIRIFEIRAYNKKGTPVLFEKGMSPVANISSTVISGDIDKNDNIALGKKVEANYDGSVENLVDGDLSTRFTTGTEVFGGVVWCTVDLGTDIEVDRIQVIPNWDGKRYYQYLLYASLDGEEWKLVADESENTDIAASHGKTFQINPAKLRYIAVKTTFNSGGIYDNWQMLETDIAEIRVSGN